MLKSPAASLAALLLCALPAGAQTTTDVPAAPSATESQRHDDTAADLTQAGAFITAVSPHLIRVSKLVGIGVIGSDPVRIGKVDDLVLSRDGRAVAVVIATGGLLGLGEKRVGVPFDTVLWNTADGNRAVGTTDVITGGTQTNGIDAEAGTRRMPGGQVSSDTYNSQNIGQSGRTDPAQGSSAPLQPASAPATELLVGRDGGASHAVVRLTRGDLQMAPAFRYVGDQEGARK